MEAIMTQEIITGYKATDKDMRCKDFQYELGKWYEAKGELVMCENGFHFCPYPSGVWAYYSDPGTRVFRVEAMEVVKSDEPGADVKCVARHIRLIEEIEIGGDGNTGDGNTGNGNTGNRNTGDGNTGYRNTGYRNTGDRNTGDQNTGDQNTGDRNTGDGNTGDRNTGYGNTGDGNATDYSAGYFCQKEPTVICFDVDTGMNRDEFQKKYGDLVRRLLSNLFNAEMDYEKYRELPGWTLDKINSLHQKYLDRRQS
jgi:hypothetical protein